MTPFQSDNLMASVFGTAVDLSAYGLEDGKAKAAELLDGLPTVSSLNRGARTAAG
jgi:hypothetical protein